MIYLTDETYARLAARLFEKLKTSGNYFNGRIEYDTADFYSTLTCSAIVYRSQGAGNGPVVPSVEKIVPVWWEFSACVDGAMQEHDFSWSEFTQFFPYA